MNNEFIQAQNSVFFKQLDICCKKVANGVSEKSISEWRNSDYIKLSGLLYRKTKVHLSENTLKRIFGKLKTSTRYYPQKATRDALAQFIGFKDWNEFEILNPINEKEIEYIPVTPDINVKKNKKSLIFFTIVLFIIAIIAIVYSFERNADVDNVKLICLNPEGKSPHSAIFKLSIDGKISDELKTFKVDFADGSFKWSTFEDSIANHYYETPGKFFPVLYHKNIPIDTASVYLQSKGWDIIASMLYDTTRVYPILKKVAKESDFHVTPKELTTAGIDTNKTFFVSFSNVKPTGISADNFEFNADVNTSAERAGVRCSQVNIVIFGNSGDHTLTIMKPECTAWSAYKFSEISRKGEKDDLRQLGYDLTSGGKVKLKISNQHVTLVINNKEIFKTEYKMAIGKLMGFKIAFSGIGSFKNFNLFDLKTGEKF